MSVTFVRPKISDLVFHLYGRSVHPELFEVYDQFEISLREYTATVRICAAGHVVGVRSHGRVLTEVATTCTHPLPKNKRLIEKPLRGIRDESYRFPGGGRYQVSFQLERLDPEVYLNFHEELLMDCHRAELSHRFPAGNRLSPEPLSLIRTETTVNSLLIHAYHSFPDDCAVIKTQSLFEF